MSKLVKLTSYIDRDLQVPCLTSDPEKCEQEPTFMFNPKLFGILNIEIG